jgi:hypothetical protein
MTFRRVNQPAEMYPYRISVCHDLLRASDDAPVINQFRQDVAQWVADNMRGDSMICQDSMFLDGRVLGPFRRQHRLTYRFELQADAALFTLFWV